MKVKLLVYALPALVLTIIHLAQAQQPEKVPRLGYLSNTDPATESTPMCIYGLFSSDRYAARAWHLYRRREGANGKSDNP